MAAVTSAHVDYHQPAKFDDELSLWTRCASMGKVRFRVEYEIWREADAALVVSGYTEHALLAHGSRCGRSGFRTGCGRASSGSRRAGDRRRHATALSASEQRIGSASGPRERVTLELTGVAHGGEAIGRHEGRVFFVPYGLPGETVVAEIVQDKADYARAEIVEIVEASPERVTAPCAYFGACGGCQWQHAELSAPASVQARHRGRAASADRPLRGCRRAGAARPSGWPIRGTIGITPGSRSGGGSGELCFTRSGTRQLLRIDHCWLMQPTIDALLARLQRRLPGFRAHQLSIRVSANTGDLLVNPELPPLGEPVPLPEEEAERSGSAPFDPSAERPHGLGPAPEQPIDDVRRALARRRDSLRPDRAVRGATGAAVPGGGAGLLPGEHPPRAARPGLPVAGDRRALRPLDLAEDGLSIAETLVLLGLDRLDLAA